MCSLLYICLSTFAKAKHLLNPLSEAEKAPTVSCFLSLWWDRDLPHMTSLSHPVSLISIFLFPCSKYWFPVTFLPFLNSLLQANLALHPEMLTFSVLHPHVQPLGIPLRVASPFSLLSTPVCISQWQTCPWNTASTISYNSDSHGPAHLDHWCNAWNAELFQNRRALDELHLPSLSVCLLSFSSHLVLSTHCPILVIL